MEDGVKRAVLLTINSGYQIEQDAFNFLREIANRDDLEEIMKKTMVVHDKTVGKEKIITRLQLESIIKEYFSESKDFPLEIPTGKDNYRPYAKDVSSEIEILSDPGQDLGTAGNINDFLEYFRDRFIRLKKIFKERLDAHDALTIKEALQVPSNREIRIIAMVTEKREKNKTTILQIEDQENTANVIVPFNIDKLVLNKIRFIALDEVLCFYVIRGQENTFIVKNILWPDIPEKKPKGAKIPVCVGLMSDIHVGSKTFLYEEFQRFIFWLNGNLGNSRQKELAGRIKYITIAGDLVDGIGVYPKQENELKITDIYKQYENFAQLIEQIPDYIDIVVIPGNHDAVRQAMPQTALPKKYLEPIIEAREIISLGNPATVKLHGVNFLLYHGRSLEDVIGIVPDMGYQTPEKAMEYLLKIRHLAPVYGNKTLISPEKRDYLVIDDPPDIFHAGHIHVTKNEVYRGVNIVNSGAWQSQTEFQRKMGLIPTPGILPIADLQKMQVTSIDFMRSA